MELKIMNCRVKKRDDMVVDFDGSKIAAVMEKVFKEYNTKGTVQPIVDMVTTRIRSEEHEIITTATINKYVEEELMRRDHFEEAHAFVLYRNTDNEMNGMMISTNPRDYLFYSRYANYLPDLGRRETWEEAVSRVRDMHLRRYPIATEEINWAFDQVLDMRVLPSMRALQFGGPAVEKNNARQYNCTYGVVDNILFFREAMFLLLSGCGVGFSVEYKYVDKLPTFSKIDDTNVNTFKIPDTIEGWSDAIDTLIKSYAMGYIVEFDYSEIRPRGSRISSGGKAPGHVPLKRALEKIRLVLDDVVNKREGVMRPIDAYDITMHIADAVISGGVRRSACICLFSPDDSDMLKAKTGDWFKDNPQRGRSNNSVKLVREETSFSQFKRYFQEQKAYGEPGFYFVSNQDAGCNPCQPGFATVLTPEGIRTFDDIEIGSTIWSETGWTTVTDKQYTGNKFVYEYRTTAGSFIGTNEHRVKYNGEKIEVQHAPGIDLLQGVDSINNSVVHDPMDIMDGLIIGDGCVHWTSADKIYLLIGENDQDYFTSEVSDLIHDKHPACKSKGYCVDKTITEDELPVTHYRQIPRRFLHGSQSKVCGFLRGLYSANGSVVNGRVTLKATSLPLIKNVQVMLSSVGIRSYYTTNHPSTIKHHNGTYTSKVSYDLNISTDRNVFYNVIGFIQEYKMDKLKGSCTITPDNKLKTHDVVEVDFLGVFQVYDITVDNEPHTYWSGGLNVSNCCEIGLMPFLPKGYKKSNGSISSGEESGFQMCNLTTINGNMLETPEDFEIAARASAIIGTLQAGYTDFTYLRSITKDLCDREALLGCSITGIMDNPLLTLDTQLQTKMAKLIVNVNKELTAKIGINQAARCTCVKPEGSASLLLGTASGIHPRYAKRYFRRIQANNIDPVYKFFAESNEHCCEKSVWNNNGTDDVITFCIESPAGAITKSDLTAIEFLQNVRSTQQHWVKNGTALPDSSPGVLHNVSNTCTVKEDEWDEVCKYIYDNREDFTGVSLLADDPNIYQQAPHQEVLTSADARHWLDLVKDYKEVDFTELHEAEDNTVKTDTIACAGGACELSL